VRLLAGSGELVDAGEVVFECGHLGLVELVLVGAVDGDEPQLVTESGGEAREVLASTFRRDLLGPLDDAGVDRPVVPAKRQLLEGRSGSVKDAERGRADVAGQDRVGGYSPSRRSTMASPL
jgi:hypothetical protein